MSALDVLRKIKSARRGENKSKAVEWGSADYINSVGVEKMNGRELRNHLAARDLDTGGTRLEQIGRLRASLKDEQLSRYAYKETLATENIIAHELEERGSVYAVGDNSKGQLGQGDLLPRNVFTLIKRLSGIQAYSISTGTDMCYAVSEKREVYVWGGGGVGRRGIAPPPPAKANKKGIVDRQNLNLWLEPQIVDNLKGEECTLVSIGSSHCLACGKSGDCFVWGDNDTGQLGLGGFDNQASVAINHSFPTVLSISAGANHSVVLTASGDVFTWGHALNGRLGNGSVARLGVPDCEKSCFPIPYSIANLESISQVSCGADHTLAIGISGVWAWGCGSGGKLGLGDNKDRWTPTLLPRSRGRSVLMVAAGTWHSHIIIAYPPMISGGFLYSCGSGYHGQLALGDVMASNVPEIVDYFANTHLLIKYVSAGSHHCAAITIDDELYTWGSNKYGCLARNIDELDVEYTSTPGHCGGFGALVSGVGRGLVRQVACGKEFMLVSTWPYDGPDLETARLILEEQELNEEDDIDVGSIASNSIVSNSSA